VILENTAVGVVVRTTWVTAAPAAAVSFNVKRRRRTRRSAAVR